MDAHLVVVDKPAEMLSVPGRGPQGQDCAARRVQEAYGAVGVVHRLDMSTSGLLVFARDAHAQRALSQAFAERRVFKRYEALVEGWPQAAQGVIDLPLMADWPQRPRQKVDLVDGKPSITRWTRLRPEKPGGARLALEPETGRSHQLRVHLTATGHPIWGDNLYAPPPVLAKASRLCLHASVLSFEHPHTGQTLRFESPVPF